MPGNTLGGKKAAAKNKERDPDFYKRIGAKGGSKKTDKLKGFARDRRLAMVAGAKGGAISRRGKANGK